jgi:hypothetical protein
LMALNVSTYSQSPRKTITALRLKYGPCRTGGSLAHQQRGLPHRIRRHTRCHTARRSPGVVGSQRVLGVSDPHAR